MEKKFENKRKRISIILIFLAVIFIVIMTVNTLSKKDETNNVENTLPEDTTNYEVTTDGNKVNTSEKVAEDKKVGNVLLESTQIVHENGTSKLTSKVTNDSVAKDNLEFKVKFIANDGSVITESVGYIGSIKANETKYISSYITIDVSNAKNITYEIVNK